MSADKSFRNQRASFRRLSPSYAHKPRDNAQGQFASRKCNRSVAFWTMAEFRFLSLLETDPSVVLFEERPAEIMMRDGPEWFAYTPHFYVRLDGHDVYVELSRDGCPRSRKQEQIAELARGHFASLGARFAELSTQAMMHGIRADNARLLMRYLSTAPSVEQVLQIRDALRAGPASMLHVEQASGASRERLLAMLRRGEISVDQADSIGPDAVLSLSVRGDGQ